VQRAHRAGEAAGEHDELLRRPGAADREHATPAAATSATGHP